MMNSFIQLWRSVRVCDTPHHVADSHVCCSALYWLSPATYQEYWWPDSLCRSRAVITHHFSTSSSSAAMAAASVTPTPGSSVAHLPPPKAISKESWNSYGSVTHSLMTPLHRVLTHEFWCKYATPVSTPPICDGMLPVLLSIIDAAVRCHDWVHPAKHR